jgi:hypothetical protein
MLERRRRIDHERISTFGGDGVRGGRSWRAETAIAGQTTITVKIPAIDPKAPSVTFTGSEGETRTIKVKDPARLQGVEVGDTVELSYTEAIALKVTKAAKK